MTNFTPAYDNKIYQKYSKKNLQNKEKNKISFCQDFGLDYKEKTALLCLSFPLTKGNGLNMLKEVILGVLEQDVIIALTGIGTKEYQKFFDGLVKYQKRKITIVNETRDNKRKLYAASDIFLCTCTTEECIEEAENAMNYGVIPISPQYDGIKNYNGLKEEGYAFTYKANSSWDFFAALIRALENFKFPYDWEVIQKNAMSREESEVTEE